MKTMKSYKELEEEVLKELQITVCEKCGASEATALDPKWLAKWLTTAMRRVAEETAKAALVEEDKGINLSTGMPNYLEYNKGWTVGHNAAVEQTQSQLTKFLEE